MWVSLQDPASAFLIESLVQIEYYSAKYMDKSIIKIEDNYLYSTSIDGDVYKYKIISLTDSKLELLYMSSGRILTYEKRE